MEIFELKEKESISENVKINRIYIQFQKILKELRKKELPESIVESINQRIEELNSISHRNKELKKLFKQNQAKIIKLLEKELKIVPKYYYRNLWLTLGVFVFGFPIGLLIGAALGLTIMDNFSYFGVGISMGISIGMCIGIVLGSGMDKKALTEGRQLDVEIKY